MPAASALEKLNIQPLVLPEEARQLMPAEDQPQQQQSAAPGMPAAVHLDQIPPVEAWGQDTFLVSGCEPESAPLRVAVLVSGGVDSSLALKLVTAAGHAATAFYLQIWFQEDFRNFWDACPWEEDLQYAQQVCDALGVPLVVVPLTQQYWDRVVSHSVAEIKEGRTPNPDMLCNSRWVVRREEEEEGMSACHAVCKARGGEVVGVNWSSGNPHHVTHTCTR